MSMDTFHVESLSQQCVTYILMHFEELSIEELSHLPLLYRWGILCRLPIADVCQLENSQFVRDLDLFHYWRSIFSQEDSSIYPDYSNKYTSEYFNERWSDRASLEKSIVYGTLFTNALGFLPMIHTSLQVEDFQCVLSIMSILYGIRKLGPMEDYGSSRHLETVLKSSHDFPPRYQKYMGQNFVESAVECFKGDLPTFFHIGNIKESSCEHLRRYFPYLKNLHYLGVSADGDWFGPPIQEFVVEIVQTAANLEVIYLHETSPLSLERFFLGLSKCSTFLSKMYLLRVQGGYGGVKLDLVPICVSYESFKKLIDAYLATTAPHRQVMHFERMIIDWKNFQEVVPDVNCSGMKVIEFSSCDFIVKANSVFCR